MRANDHGPKRGVLGLVRLVFQRLGRNPPAVLDLLNFGDEHGGGAREPRQA